MQHNLSPCLEGQTYGFWGSLWHGIIAPFSWVVSLFQAGAYLRDLPINRIRWSIDNNAVDQVGVAARFYDNGSNNSILQSELVREKFDLFYPDAPPGTFDTPQSTCNFITDPANNQWFNTMFNNLAY